MLSYFKRKLEKRRLKRTFQEYGSQINHFDLAPFGKIAYAQWLHPFEGEKAITKDQIDFFADLLPKGAFAIDIGAHTGDTTVPMALAAGNEGTVLGLEPNPYVFKILQKNASLNTEHTHIIPACFAATEEDGTYTFQYSDASFCNGGYLDHIESSKHKHDYELQVQGKNLEAELRNTYAKYLPLLRLIKVDAEGYDKEILKSIEGIIREFKPNLLVECYKRLTIDERNDLYEVITRMGYALYYIEGFTKHTKREKLDAASMLDRKHFEMLAVPVQVL